MPVSTIDSTGLTPSGVTPASLDSNAQYTGFKNRIINGAMAIWQRGTSFTSGGSATYTADRFFGNGSSGTISRSTDVPTGFTYSFSNAASSTAFPGVSQRIESVNIADCASQAITVSFYVKQTSGTASALNINLSYPNAVDNYSSSTTIVETNVVAAMSATWTRYSYTYTLPANVTNGLSVTLFIPSVSITATFLITGIQLEKGSTATSFDYRPYGTELALCQRYFQICAFSGVAYNTAEMGIASQFKVTMRAQASMSTVLYNGDNYTGSSNTIVRVGVGNTSVGSASYNAASTGNNIGNILCTGLTASNIYFGSFQASAEL